MSMKKMRCSKLRFPFETKGRHLKEEVINGSTSHSNVIKEYGEAFRTNSYIEMCNKVQGRQLEISKECLYEQSSSSSLSSSPPSQNVVHLFEYLIESRQETLVSQPNLPQYLVNYFKISSEACTICESLLADVQQVRINYYSIKKILMFIKRVPANSDWTNNQYHAIYKSLALYTSHENPFSMLTEKFQELHLRQALLFHELTSQYRKTKRRIKFIRHIKRVVASLLVVGCGALVIASLLLAIHSMVGLVAAPGLLVLTLGLFNMKKIKKPKQKWSKSWHETLGKQLDIAARGVYILINDFDTIGRLVQRLYDEMEHMKFVADICVRKGKIEMMKQVVKEFEMEDSYFLEQLDELEKQIYLCFLDINRSRRVVVQEMAKY